jgi:hypothetical protein
VCWYPQDTQVLPQAVLGKLCLFAYIIIDYPSSFCRGTHSGGMDGSPLSRAILRACYNECGAKDFCYNYLIPVILYYIF